MGGSINKSSGKSFSKRHFKDGKSNGGDRFVANPKSSISKSEPNDTTASWKCSYPSFTKSPSPRKVERAALTSEKRTPLTINKQLSDICA